jgi:hypothetical protein
MSDRKPVCWGIGDDCERPLDDREHVITVDLEDCDPLPETITVIGFARTVVEPSDCPSVLANLLESLDAEYGDPDGDYTNATAEMLAAEEVFIKAVLAEYHVAIVEPVTSEEINVQTWVKEHAPHWLEDA